MTSRVGTLSLRSVLALGLITFLMMLPETLPVPVLRALVVERFRVGESLGSLFMAANMIGALLAAPLIGAWVDRTGQRRRLAVAALLADALLMQAMAHPASYASFLLLRAMEGAVHITALTLTMSLAADAAGDRRGRALGCLGAGLTLGVATGAAVGGWLGKNDPLYTLHAASAVLVLATVLAAWLLPPDQATSNKPGWRDLLTTVAREPAVRVPLVIAFVERFTVGFFTTGFPLMLASVHGVDRPRIGMLLGAFLFPFAVLSWPFGRLAEKWSRRHLVLVGSLVYGLGVMFVGAVPVAWLWGLMPLLGIGSAVMFVPSLLWLLEAAPGVGRTTAMAAFHAAGSLGFLLGPLCCGRLIALGGEGADGHGYVLAFAVAGLAEILAALLVVISCRRVLGARTARDLPR